MGRNKLESITLRVSAEFKQRVITQARAQNRSMTTYLEWLVMQAAQTTGNPAQTEPKNRRG